MDRIKKIVKISIQGIIVNALLSTTKAIVGIVANSIAIVLDAVNNLSDVITQLITIIGIKIAGKRPDKEHPYGHGRIEYITSVILSVLLILTGILSLKESIIKVIHPVMAEYTVSSFIVIIVSIVVKFVFGRYVKKIGDKINSGSLKATGTDSYLDAVITFATLVAAIISKLYHISIEGALGIVFSGIIIKSGFEILMETLNNIVGLRIEGDLSKKIKNKVKSYEGVIGAYDLALHNYGPTSILGSVHIEVDDEMKAKDIHKLIRKITIDVFEEYGIVLTIGIYANNMEDEENFKLKKDLDKIISKYPVILQVHAFYFDPLNKYVTFDIVVSFEEKDPEKLKNKIIKELKEKYDDLKFYIIIDRDLSD